MGKKQEARTERQDVSEKGLSLDIKNQLLGLFRYWNSDRPNLRHNMEVKWLDQVWVCTTNTHALILILNPNEEIEVTGNEKSPNIREVLPGSVDEYAIDIDRLNKVTSEIPMITRFRRQECEACEGNGKFNHHGEEYDCKTCDEEGYIELGFKETIQDPEYFIEIDGKHLAIDRWSELTRVVKGIKPKKITLLRNEEKPALALFRLDDEIVIALAKTYMEKDIKFDKVVSYLMNGEEVDHG